MVWEKRLSLLIFILISIWPNFLLGMFATNLFRPWDINLRPPQWVGANLQWTTWFEDGYKSRGYNLDGNEVSPTQIWTAEQDALAMLKGFGSDSPMTRFLVDILEMPEDNGIRGNFLVTGDFKAKDFGIALRYHAPHHITLALFLPFFEMNLNKVFFQDLTQDVTMSDFLVKSELTSQIKQRVHEFDPSLNLDGWKKLGFGDLVMLAEWRRNFYQGKPILKNVALCARLGLTFPTGVKINEDEVLSVPFGFDGAVGIIFGGGIDLYWFDIFSGGLDVEFIQLFGNTRIRRIKVHPDQTDFLLLAKTQAYRDYGFTQRFNLYVGSRLWRGFSATLTYQFWKHGDDKLTVCTNEFSDNIANTAQSLREWTTHHMIARLIYDGQCDFAEKSLFKPQFCLFYKFPFNGQRAILFNTYGFTLTFNF